MPLNVGWMQNTLASVAAAAEPPAEMAPAGAPFSVMVRAEGVWNAPLSRCLQAVQGSVGPGHPDFRLEQPASFVHGTGGFLKSALNGLPQKPQKTLFWVASFTAVFVDVPVVSWKGMGMEPMNAALGGGQSWLVGHCGPVTRRVPGVHAMPSLGPPWHVLSPGQMGQG